MVYICENLLMNMKKIGIIGGGFSGIMTAVHLIEKATIPLKIDVYDKENSFARGVAYNPISKKHILNVIASRMSAYLNKPDDFVDYVMGVNEFQNFDRSIISNSFLPRYLYGDYLTQIWEKSKAVARSKNIEVNEYATEIEDINEIASGIEFLLSSGETRIYNTCVLATGNQLPSNLKLPKSILESNLYSQNPWNSDVVKDIEGCKRIVILGNGLTMVDMVISLLEHSYKGEIISISPNGFNILPHRHNGMKYEEFKKELSSEMGLKDIFLQLKKHIRILRRFGISAEPIIDSLRPQTQEIWKRLSLPEKELFMRRFRHLWGVARHRIPLHMHDLIQKLRIDGSLKVIAGKLLDVEPSNQALRLKYLDKHSKSIKEIECDRLINCTGPESQIQNLQASILKRMLERGMIRQDELKLGIQTDTNTYQIQNPNGKYYNQIYTLGSNLRGELWESTAVGELRLQAERLAEVILKV